MKGLERRSEHYTALGKVKERPTNNYSASFGTVEGLKMSAVMTQLVDLGLEFNVVDDRGGTNAWIIQVAPTTASKRILPDVSDVQWYEDRELAFGIAGLKAV